MQFFDQGNEYANQTKAIADLENEYADLENAIADLGCVLKLQPHHDGS